MSKTTENGRRGDILQSARQIFRERGYEGASVDDIAHHAGIAKGTVYLYFDSKLAILEALVDSYYEMMVEAISPALKNGDSAGAIRKAVHAGFEVADRERDLVVLLDLRLGLSKTKNEAALGNPMAMKNIRRFLRECQSRGELRQFDPAIAAILMAGLLQWITKFCLVWLNEDIAKYEETAVRMLQYALLKDYKD